MNSVIFRTASHIVTGLMLLFSVYLFFRGHNQPGGGFIGALIAVIAFGLLMLSESAEYVRAQLKQTPLFLGLVGILILMISAVIPFFFGEPLLTGLWWKDILPLGTPLLFDLGVYLAVIGGVLGILLKVDEELS
ncbi:MAG: Na(+)/H(+) antiporter subunit B [Saccharospirillum sp.]|nr:Na(+)/H(+) antiporter subunit B [Saccharospirillum sp.]